MKRRCSNLPLFTMRNSKTNENHEEYLRTLENETDGGTKNVTVVMVEKYRQLAGITHS